jgi:hypothetical protein
VASLTAAGWKLLTRVENNQAMGNMRQLISRWENEPRAVVLTLTEVRTGGAEISANVTMRFAP